MKQFKNDNKQKAFEMYKVVAPYSVREVMINGEMEFHSYNNTDHIGTHYNFEDARLLCFKHAWIDDIGMNIIVIFGMLLFYWWAIWFVWSSVRDLIN